MKLFYLFIVTLLICSAGLQAYTAKIYNNSGEPIQVKIEYVGAPLFCKNDNLILQANPNDPTIIQLGGCCTSRFIINSIAYPFPGSSDLSWGCRSYTISIKKAGIGVGFAIELL